MHLYKVDLSNEEDVRTKAKKVKEEHDYVSIVLLGELYDLNTIMM